MSEDDIQRRIAFGIDAEAFLNSPLGRIIQGRAVEEVDDALEALKTVDPEDAKSIRDLQNRAYRAESVKQWIFEVIQDGLEAQRILIEGE